MLDDSERTISLHPPFAVVSKKWTVNFHWKHIIDLGMAMQDSFCGYGVCRRLIREAYGSDGSRRGLEIHEFIHFMCSVALRVLDSRL